MKKLLSYCTLSLIPLSAAAFPPSPPPTSDISNSVPFSATTPQLNTDTPPSNTNHTVVSVSEVYEYVAPIENNTTPSLPPVQGATQNATSLTEAIISFFLREHKEDAHVLMSCYHTLDIHHSHVRLWDSPQTKLVQLCIQNNIEFDLHEIKNRTAYRNAEIEAQNDLLSFITEYDFTRRQLNNDITVSADSPSEAD